MEMVVTLALILTFSPGEKGQLLCVSGFANPSSSNPGTRISCETESDFPLTF